MPMFNVYRGFLDICHHNFIEIGDMPYNSPNWRSICHYNSTSHRFIPFSTLAATTGPPAGVHNGDIISYGLEYPQYTSSLSNHLHGPHILSPSSIILFPHLSFLFLFSAGRRRPQRWLPRGQGPAPPLADERWQEASARYKQGGGGDVGHGDVRGAAEHSPRPLASTR